MTKHVCLNGTMANTEDFLSPVPVIGVYIAAVSLLCFLLIVCDVWAGFKTKKTWFPCRYLSFNSITLTLISVAAKIPVDLTTSMPSVQDQLSKLCGTVFICVIMCFMLPSVTTNAEFESYANVTALSIFVITVVVNICIQLATGVIFAFIPEHVIILVCMLLLLIRFWFTVCAMNAGKGDYGESKEAWIQTGEENLVARLKGCYIYSYKNCLQLYACGFPYLADVGIVCITSSVVLAQAMLRSLGLNDFKFCKGAVSDYGWSMWLLVVTQILTVAVVTLVVGFRWLINRGSFAVLENVRDSLAEDDPYEQFEYLLSLIGSPRFVVKSFRYVFYFPVCFINLAVTVMNTLVSYMTDLLLVKCCMVCNGDEDPETIRVSKNLLKKHGILDANISLLCMEIYWASLKGVADMEKWININREYGVKHISNMLTVVPPTDMSSLTIGSDDVRGVKFSSLSMIVIAEIMMRVMPTSRSNISNVLKEAFEIILFIESNLQAGKPQNRLRSSLAKSLYKFGLRSGADNMLKVLFVPQYSGAPAFCYYLWELEENGTLSDAIEQVHDSVNAPLEDEDRRPSSEVVCRRLEQLFVDMLHAFLVQLPLAVFTHVLESPVEEFHDRVKCGLRFLYRLEPLESHITFSLPPGITEFGVSSIFNAQTSTTNMHAQVIHAHSQSTTVPTTEPAVEHSEIQIWSAEDVERDHTAESGEF